MHYIKQLLLSTLFCVLAVSCGQAADNKSDAKEGEFLGAMQTEYPSWFKESFLDFKEDVAEAAKAGKRLMVLFHQDGCPYCNALVEQNLAQKDIETTVRKHFDVVALNMWGSREVASIGGKSYTEKSFAAALKVQFTPTILFFNEQGKIILRLNGYLPPKKFKHAIDYVANKLEDKINYVDYMAKQLPNEGKLRGELNKQDFFAHAPYQLNQTGGKPLAVFFEQRDCPNCDVLHNKILVNKDIRKTLTDFNVVQLDMWSDTKLTTPQGKSMSVKQWAKAMNVKYAPTIIVFDKQGNEVIRSEAFFKVFHTNGILSYVQSEAFKTQPSFQRYLTDKAHDIRASGQNVDIWSMESEK